jgi:hypothetical protein
VSVAIRGTVKSSTARRALLKRGRDALARKEHDGEIVVALDDGSEVLVSIARDTKFAGEGAKTRAVWSELRTRPEAEGIDPRIVPAFAEVELLVHVPRMGAAISVYGDVTDTAFVEAATHREAPPQRPVAMRAVVVGLDADATLSFERAVAELYPAVKRPAERGPFRPTDPGDPSTPYPLIDWLPFGVACAALLATLVRFSVLVRRRRSRTGRWSSRGARSR